jgi:hypothetical protein
MLKTRSQDNAKAIYGRSTAQRPLCHKYERTESMQTRSSRLLRQAGALYTSRQKQNLMQESEPSEFIRGEEVINPAFTEPHARVYNVQGY